jgi:hypothetical protein
MTPGDIEWEVFLIYLQMVREVRRNVMARRWLYRWNESINMWEL